MVSIFKEKLIVGSLLGLLVGAILGYGLAFSRMVALEDQVSTLQGRTANRDAAIDALQTQIASLQEQVSKLPALSPLFNYTGPINYTWLFRGAYATYKGVESPRP